MWPSFEHASTIALARLGRGQGQALSEATAGRRLPSEVIERIVDRADGVPLFIEELTKTVVESGVLRAEGDRYELTGPLPAYAIPGTLHASLPARLDPESDVRRLRGEMLLSLGREDEAETELARACTVACSQGARWWELLAATALARLWRDRGKYQEAQLLLAPVYNSFIEGLDLPGVKAAKGLLDELGQWKAHPAGAAALPAGRACGGGSADPRHQQDAC